MSAVIQPTGPKQDKRNRYFQLLGYGVMTPKQAAEAQRLAGKILKADAEKAKSNAKDQAKGETARILYEARLEKCEQARTYLETLQPVTAASVKAFDEALVAAKALAQKGEHAKATEALDKVSATHAPDKGAKAWNEAATAAEKLAPRAFQAMKRIDALLADPESRLDRASIAATRKDKFDQARVLLAPKAAKATLDGATQQLEVLLDTLRNKIDQAKADWTKTELLRAETSRKLNMIAPLTGDELPLLNDREAAPMRLQLASAATSMNLCDFAGARAVLTPLHDELDAIADRLGPQRAEWQQRAPRLRPLAEECKQFAAAALCPKVKQDAAALSAQLQQLLAEGPGKSRTLGESIDLVDGASARMDALRGQEQAFMLYQRKASGPLELGPDGKPVKPLETSKKDIERLFGEVDAALKKLHSAVSKATQGNHETVADAPFVQRRDAAQEEWKRRVAGARDPQTLDEAGMTAQLQALKRDILATQAAPAKLQVAIDDGRLGRRVQAYHEARTAAMDACDELLARDAMAGADARLAVERICEPIIGLADIGTPATMIAAYDDAIASLKSKAKRIVTKTAALQQDVKAKQDALVLRLEAMGKRVLEVKALADAAKNASKQAPLVALFETLQASLDGLRAMARLGQRDGLVRTDEEADEFEKEIEQSLAAAKGDSDDTMSFDKARKAIADLKDKLGEKKYRLYCVATQDSLSTQVKELEEQLGTTTMGELTRRIAELRGKLNDLKLKADLAEKETQKFESDVVKPLLKRLDDKAFKDAAEYRATMKSQIEALVGDFRFEDGQEAAKKKATALGDKLTAVLQGAKDPSGMPQALAAEQAAARKAANDKIVEQGKWDGEVVVLEKKLAALKPANPREVEPLIDLLDSARTTTKKSGDHAAGRAQLAAIRKRMSLLAANPRGLAISARNKLPQVNARVRRAIVAYQEGLATIGKAIQALPPTDLDAAGKQAVADQLDALRGLFNPGSFEDAVATLSAKGGSREQRSGEREKGLREVRRMQAYLSNDVRLRTLRESPWNPGMTSVLSELMLALLDIENNMLVSI